VGNGCTHPAECNNYYSPFYADILWDFSFYDETLRDEYLTACPEEEWHEYNENCAEVN